MKASQIIVAVLVSCVVVSTVFAILFYNFSKGNSSVIKSAGQEIVPIENIDGTKTIYGVRMRDTCFNKFEDFMSGKIK